MTILQTKSLNLRPCQPSDSLDFMALERDPDVMRFLNGGVPVDQEQGDPESDFLMPRGTEEHVWTARRTSDDTFVGWFCLWPDAERVAELGYRLRQDMWGKGFATEGAEALIRWGFETCHYDRVFAGTMAVNNGSRKVMEKIGMVYVKTFILQGARPIPGSEHGDVEYEITRPAWEKRNSRSSHSDVL